MGDRKVLAEVGRLCGVKDPGAFADWVLSPPCQHFGEWDHDPELCPEPCGQAHEWCRACGRPMKPECPILIELENASA